MPTPLPPTSTSGLYCLPGLGDDRVAPPASATRLPASRPGRRAARAATARAAGRPLLARLLEQRFSAAARSPDRGTRRAGELGRERLRLGLQRLRAGATSSSNSRSARSGSSTISCSSSSSSRAVRIALALPAEDRGAHPAAPRVRPAARAWRRSRRGNRRTRRRGGVGRRRRRHGSGRADPRPPTPPSLRVPPPSLPPASMRLLRRQRLLAHRLERDQPVERAEQLADVVDVERRHGLEHARVEPGAALLRLAAQDRHPGLVVGRGDVDDEPARESADQPLVQRFDLGRAGGRW